MLINKFWRAWLIEARRSLSPCNLNLSPRVSMSLSHCFMDNADKLLTHLFFSWGYEESSAQLEWRRDFWPFHILSSGQVEVRRHHLHAFRTSFLTSFLATWMNFPVSLLVQLVCHQNTRMAAAFVPVPVPVASVHRSLARRKSPTPDASSVNCELSAKSRAAWLREAPALGNITSDTCSWTSRQDSCNGMSTLQEVKGSNKPSYLGPTLIGYEVLQKRARSTVNITKSGEYSIWKK